MDDPVVERRRDTRFGSIGLVDVRATVRPGCPVSLIDLSAGGVLVEAPRPLRPGARVHLQVTHGRRSLALGGMVLRCSVSSVDPDRGVLYRGALRFDHPCALFRAPQTREGCEVPMEEGPFGMSDGQPIPAHAGPCGPDSKGARK